MNRESERPSLTQSFDWPVVYEAERLLRERLDVFLGHNGFGKQLAERMSHECGLDFFEWIDHFVLAEEEETALQSAGFICDESAERPEGEVVFEYPRATLPRVILRRGVSESPAAVALRPEYVADFVARQDCYRIPEGEPLSRFRRVFLHREHGTRLEAVERRAYRGFVPAPVEDRELKGILRAKEIWRTRPRSYLNDADGFGLANQMLDIVLDLVGADMGCEVFFEAEREYWQRRNRAARVQKERQDKLGLGWGNHDHHTFRCSREHFADFIMFLLRLGFVKRERYYAGAEAGWGAQICEQPIAGIVVFADVDLMPDETAIDFSTQKLPPAPRLGTVGLWVGLHGESFLEAGMHHLEARFDFNRLREQLQECGVSMMAPFSDFEFLRQAFTEGERWPVAAERAERLLSDRLITRQQFEQFVQNGALGSHLENLQRHGGFKGFNQKSVSAVIAATDARKHAFGSQPVAA
jgi:hypothetical protein